MRASIYDDILPYSAQSEKLSNEDYLPNLDQRETSNSREIRSARLMGDKKLSSGYRSLKVRSIPKREPMRCYSTLGPSARRSHPNRRCDDDLNTSRGKH